MNDAGLDRAAKGAAILDAVANYGRAVIDAPPPRPQSAGFLFHASDEYFWTNLPVAPHPQPFGSAVGIPMPLILSEWVARVPGLYWTESARLRRAKGRELVESRSGHAITLKPFGKSEVVAGGVGTLKLPPSNDGYHLVTITSSANASAGVPALISPEVWDHHHLGEGAVVSVTEATWQPMSGTWTPLFPTTSHLPRAYIRIDDPDAVTVTERGAATEVHPFSIMKYYSGAAELFAFVFDTAYTTDPGHRREVERFFETYRNAEGRMGEYLLDADVTQPMWRSRYHSPAELRQAEELLERRIHDAMIGIDLTERILIILSQLNHGELQRISDDLGIPPQTWFQGESVAKEAVNFLARVPRERTASVIDGIRNLHPELIKE